MVVGKVREVIHPLLRGIATFGGLFFVPSVLLSVFTQFCLPSSVSFSSFDLVLFPFSGVRENTRSCHNHVFHIFYSLSE